MEGPRTPTASPTPASTGHALAAANGSGVGGSVTTSSDAAGTTLTATITGLTPGQQYLCDADPLSCMFFVGGASQSFTKAFTADAGGRATVVWTVPPGMASNANVQALENGRFVAIACTDLR